MLQVYLQKIEHIRILKSCFNLKRYNLYDKRNTEQ